ncbi:MAG: CsgG/HfaB family protein [Halarsenatibacteraceae bacterium]
MKKYKFAVLISLSLILIFGIVVEAENFGNKNEFEKLQEEILADKDDILSSEPNVNRSTQLLASLPEPEEKSSIAVFTIADKTGQRTEDGSALVSQGAGDMLITALKRSRQFKVLERLNNDSIMNEHELKNNNLIAAYEGPGLNELAGADYILDGSVTEYQVDKASGGTGLSIAGVGGSKENAVASTAIDLKLVDTTSGEVVWSRSLRDELAGKRVGAEAFEFMGDNIVEFETGQGKQEVINLVLRRLLEEAVFELSEFMN